MVTERTGLKHWRCRAEKACSWMCAGGGRKDRGIGGASEGFLNLSPGRDGETMKGVMEDGYGSRFLEL